MNLSAERREEIAKIVSIKRQTTIDGIFYALEGTDYEASKRTIERDLEYLIYDKNYGITKKQGLGGGIFADHDWFYSRPITNKDILTLSNAIKMLPINMQIECEKIVERIKRIKEY